MKKDIYEAIKERVLVLDGAMGTMIQRYHLTEDDFRKGFFDNHHKPLKGNNDLLSITRPDIIKTIHRQYFEAGADIVETNTFSGTTVAQADYDLEDAVYQINFQSAKIAREVADEYKGIPVESELREKRLAKMIGSLRGKIDKYKEEIYDYKEEDDYKKNKNYQKAVKELEEQLKESKEKLTKVLKKLKEFKEKKTSKKGSKK